MKSKEENEEEEKAMNSNNNNNNIYFKWTIWLTVSDQRLRPLLIIIIIKFGQVPFAFLFSLSPLLLIADIFNMSIDWMCVCVYIWW